MHIRTYVRTQMLSTANSRRWNPFGSESYFGRWNSPCRRAKCSMFANFWRWNTFGGDMLTFGGGSISFGGGFLLSLLLAVDLVVCPSGPWCSLIPVCRKSDVLLLWAVEFLLLAVKPFSSKILVRLETSLFTSYTAKHRAPKTLYNIHHTLYIPK